MAKTVIRSKRKNQIEAANEPFEKTKNLQKLYIYLVIVDYGYSSNIVNLMQSVDSTIQYVQLAKGTAPVNVTSILGLNNIDKELVWAFVKESKLKAAQKALNEYFAENQKKKIGIGFAIPLTSLMGVRIYKFLTKTF